MPEPRLSVGSLGPPERKALTPSWLVEERREGRDWGDTE